MPIRFVLFLFFYGLYTCFVLAQEYKIHRQTLGMEDGLSHRNVTTICQDARGFIWLGTTYGLNRYDGREVISFLASNNGLQENHIQTILSVSDSTIWIIHSKQVAKEIEVLNIYTQQIIPLKNYLSDFSVFESNGNLQFHNQKDGSLYMSIVETLYEYLPQERKFRFLLKIPQGCNVRQVLKNKKKEIWINAYSQNTLEAKTSHLFYISASNKIEEHTKYPDVEIQMQHLDAQGQVYFRQNIGKSYITNYTKKFGQTLVPLRFQLAGVSFVRQTYVSYYQQFWVFDKMFWHSFDLEGRHIFTLPISKAEESDLMDFFSDNQGGIWYRSLGITILHLSKNYFKNYLDRVDENGVVTSDISTRGITTDSKGHFYVCASHGLYSFTPTASGTARPELLSLKNQKSIKNQKKPIYDGRMGLAILLEKDSLLWFSDQQDKLVQYSLPKKEYQIYSHYKPKISLLTWAIYRAKNGRLWLGLNRGLSFLNTEGDSLQVFEIQEEGQRVNFADVYHFHENKAGIWLATSVGLYLMHPETGKILKSFHKDAAKGKQLPYNLITHLYEEPNGDFWLTTKGGGLIHLNPQTGDFENFTIKNGLSHNILYAVYPDSLGNLWLSSDMGIMLFNRSTHLVRTYLPRDGVPHEEFNTSSHHQAPDGTIYFGSILGFTKFHPRDFYKEEQQHNTPLVLTKYYKYNPENGGNIDLTNQYQKENKVDIFSMDRGTTLHFALLNYFDSKYNKYAYKIENYDKDWHYTEIPSIQLDGLPTGVYKLLVKAQGLRGNWSEPLEIKINVIVPFYKTVIFWIGLAIIIFLIIILVIRGRERALIEEREKLERIVEERTTQIAKDKKVIEEQNAQLQQLIRTKDRFFAIISHDLRGSVSAFQNLGELIDFYIESNRVDMLKKLAKNVDALSTNLSDLLNNLLQWAISQLGGIVLNPETFSLSGELRSIIELYHENAVSKEIIIHCEIPETLLVHTDKNSLSLILRNLISNSLKFTNKNGKIDILAHETEQEIILEICDTGRGIPKEKLEKLFNLDEMKSTKGTANEQGTGLGLILCKEFVERNGGSITIESEEGKGTKSIIRLPKKS